VSHLAYIGSKWGVELQIPWHDNFLWVGGVLLALLFVADAYLPTLEGLPVALPVLSRRRPGLASA